MSIFGRLIISYLILCSMLAGLSFYFIYQLNQFNKVTRSILLNDTSVLEYANQLSDVLLSESRYDRKYVVLKDEELYENYLQASKEFKRLLGDALLKTGSEEMRHIFYTISVQHENFNRLARVEREQIRIAKPYNSSRYEEDKKKAADVIFEQLKKIRQAGEKKVYDKIVNLSETSNNAKDVSIFISIFALSVGLVIAFLITRSIKKPLDIMRAKTVEISHGNFKSDLDVRSPPVIAELATAINTMCQRLQEVDTLKSDFFSHMSHELRTPLASIKEGTTMLLEGLGGEISEKQERILSIVIQESNRLIGLVNSLLDLSKMEAGMMKYQFSATDLNVLLKRSLETLAPLVEAKKITIENDIGDLPAIKVDQERILQVLRNLIGNAIKFSPAGGKIRLEARVIEQYVEMSVHDTGIGIPRKDLERIFVKFQQISFGKKEKIKGTGLGLATVKQIILAHGGKVWATSQEGQGSIFYITLPLAV